MKNDVAGAQQEVKVWDLFVRVFHWTLVLGFVTAFISGEVHAPLVHVLIGYYLVGLLIARVYWGFKGSEYARFRSFVFSPRETLAYAQGMIKGNPKHYLGHNPAGALMVFALLALLALILVSGLATLGWVGYEGPLVSMANDVSDETAALFREIHQCLPWVGVGLVALHLLGVVSGSMQHKENLVRAMLTGKKQAVSDSESIK